MGCAIGMAAGVAHAVCHIWNPRYDTTLLDLALRHKTLPKHKRGLTADSNSHLGNLSVDMLWDLPLQQDGSSFAQQLHSMCLASWGVHIAECSGACGRRKH